MRSELSKAKAVRMIKIVISTFDSYENSYKKGYTDNR